MTRKEQKKFVQELIQRVKAEICANIDAEKTPETWDGFELRTLIADRFARCAFGMQPPRMKAFRNHCLIKNI